VHDVANSTARCAQRVRAARELQQARMGKLNVDLSGKEIQEACGLDRHCRRLLAQARSKLLLSARGIHRVLRVARTIADLEQTAEIPAPEKQTGPRIQSISPVHLAEALQLRRAVE
jgi:predicted ATPase with chaperone activity